MSFPPATGRSRREVLHSSTLGVGTVALAWLLDRDRLLADPAKPDLEPRRFDLTPKPPHFAPKAKAMISLFMQGGPSHIDLFDPKPALAKYDGKTFPGSNIKYDDAAGASSTVMAPPWKFAEHGDSGIDVSELLPHTAGVADDLCVVRSMHTGVNNHVQSVHALNAGRIVAGHPSLGSWLCYALGAEAADLPAYVALPDPSALPVGGIDHWSSGWLPAVFQGTAARAKDPRILNLDPAPHLRGKPQEAMLQYLDELNREHLSKRPGEHDLDARIATYGRAAQMQTAAKEALDLSKESAETKRMYGLDDPATADYGTRCLLARRFVERGVRFVQVFTGNQEWDHHQSIRSKLPAACRKTDKPAAALVADLKRRGLLDSTVVMWGGEMGRLPVIEHDQGPAKAGRDHNTYGFTMWFAGGGFKRGHVHGATDEFAHHAVEGVVTHHDLHATLLHLFGLDAAKVTYTRNGAAQTLLDGHPGKVAAGLLA